MANSRITKGMSIEEVLIVMSDDNPGALMCMMKMLEDHPLRLLDIFDFDRMGIYGTKLARLWNDCCGRDISKLKETINYFSSGEVSEEEINEHLSRPYAEPFI